MSNLSLEYLKDNLATNVPQIVSIVKRIGQYPEKDYHTQQPTGKMQTLYNFRFPNGKVVRHYAKEREEETLRLFQPGEKVQVVLSEGHDKNSGRRFTYPVWTPVEGAEARAAANPQPASNTRMDADQRRLDERQQEQDEKSIAICLQGFAQAYIIQGMQTDEALMNAALARTKLLEQAHRIYVGDQESDFAPDYTPESYPG